MCKGLVIKASVSTAGVGDIKGVFDSGEAFKGGAGGSYYSHLSTHSFFHSFQRKEVSMSMSKWQEKQERNFNRLMQLERILLCQDRIRR